MDQLVASEVEGLVYNGKVLGIICDGNRRWAYREGVSVKEGYEAGLEVVKNVILPAIKDNEDFNTVVLDLFSTDNWRRPQKQVEDLMNLIQVGVDELLEQAMKEDIRIVHVGGKGPLKSNVKNSLVKAEEKTKNAKGATVVLCINYGGQEDILQAGAAAAEAGNSRGLEQYLEVPPMDLIMRTGGEQRLSNFGTWQSAYAELCFESKYFPDLVRQDMDRILGNFSNRDRRFGV